MNKEMNEWINKGMNETLKKWRNELINNRMKTYDHGCITHDHHVLYNSLPHGDKRSWTQKNAPWGERGRIGLTLMYVVGNVFFDDMHEYQMNLPITLGFTAARWHAANFVSLSTSKPQKNSEFVG